jgi:hypothetical protein
MGLRFVAVKGEQRPFAVKTSVTANQASLGLDLLLEVVARISDRRFVNEVWFVDVPALLVQFIASQGCQTVYGHNICDVRIVQWERHLFDPDYEVIAEEGDDTVEALLRRGNMEKIVWPWICQHKGVWVRWSDGRYQRIDVGKREN